MKKENNNFGSILKGLRTSMGKKQKDVARLKKITTEHNLKRYADKVGLSQSTISSMRNGSGYGSGNGCGCGTSSSL